MDGSRVGQDIGRFGPHPAPRHHAWISRFWTPDATAYASLADMYQEHPDFRTYYDKVAEGLVDYLTEAMRVYAATRL